VAALLQIYEEGICLLRNQRKWKAGWN